MLPESKRMDPDQGHPRDAAQGACTVNRVYVVFVLAILAMSSRAATAERAPYIVMLKKPLFAQPNASAPPPLRRSDIGAVGGNVFFESSDRFIVELPERAAEALRKHPAVKYLQRGVLGEPAMTKPTDVEASIDSPAMRQMSNGLRQATAATWSSGTYLYDGAGNISGMGTNEYSYDALSRVVRAKAGGNEETYTYDPFGNLTERTTNAAPPSSHPADLQTNRLVGYSYDTAGNLQGVTGHPAQYKYDPFSMMIEKNFGVTGQEFYVYTASDERIGVKSGDRWLWSFRDENGQILRQYESVASAPSAQWRWVQDYVYRDGLLVGGQRESAEGGRRHYHLDHLGSVRVITGDNGLEISRHDFYPFGNQITLLRQETFTGFDREDPMKFTAHERDFTSFLSENTNYFDYMHARFTNPNWGRFLSVDPLMGRQDRPQSWNRYAYVQNDPINRTDPSGMADFRTAGGITVVAKAPSGPGFFDHTYGDFLRESYLWQFHIGFASYFRGLWRSQVFFARATGFLGRYR